MVMASDGLQKSANQRGSLPPPAVCGNSTPLLTSTPSGREGRQRGGDVVRAQPARDQAARADGLQRSPVEGDAGAAGQAVGVGVEQIAVCAQRVAGDQLSRGRFVAGAHVDGLERRARHGRDQFDASRRR